MASMKRQRSLGNFYSEEFALLQKQRVLITDTGTNDITGFRKLLAGHIDLFPIDIEVGQYLLQKNFPADKRAQISWQKKAFWIAPMHVVIWNKHPRAKELISRFNRGLKTIKDNGDFQKIVNETRRQINQSSK